MDAADLREEKGEHSDDAGTQPMLEDYLPAGMMSMLKFRTAEACGIGATYSSANDREVDNCLDKSLAARRISYRAIPARASGQIEKVF